jgi:DNA mismatch endonuclease, patch repair protein
MDKLSPLRRSHNMRQIKSVNSKPELTLRKIIFSLGYRYRLHAASLPGRPDIVFKKRKKVIFVHGCFWHCHNNCKEAHLPKSRLGYWQTKLARNVSRDRDNITTLSRLGWKTLVIWECEISGANIRNRISRFLGKTACN